LRGPFRSSGCPYSLENEVLLVDEKQHSPERCDGEVKRRRRRSRILGTMRVRWLLAILAAVLAAGTAAAMRAQTQDTGIAIVFGVVLFVLAVVLAGAIVLPIMALRRLLGHEVLPPWPVYAAALIVSAALVFPVYGTFTRSDPADAGGGCSGIMPLPEALQNEFAGGRPARFYVAACAD
jgi:hypothetical protein